MFRSGWVRLCSAVLAATVTPDARSITAMQSKQLDDLSPRKIAAILDSYIVGQSDAKRAVSISLRNRWRRRQLKDEGLRDDIVPKNILLVGPTGVGKTEISRRMARITDAPFVKVEATKYTEVGFKGKDVESIIEDLYTNAKTKAKRHLATEREPEALEKALDMVYTAWCAKWRHSQRTEQKSSPAEDDAEDEATSGTTRHLADVTFEEFKERYTTVYKDDLVKIDITHQPSSAKPHVGPGGIDMQSVSVLLGFGADQRRVKTRVTKSVREAVQILTEEALDRLLDETQVNTLARTLAEQDGVIFIDEIDKVVVDPKSPDGDVSSVGVQQDLLPLIEGSAVTMKDGTQIRTDNILFICSGAFHTAKTSDMIAELQGRLPVRVELQALKEEDIRRILREPKFNLLRQQTALMQTEGIKVEFTDDGVDALARATTVVNSTGQNIGARRLHTILERVMDEYSFNCQDYEGKKVVINAKIVKDATEELQKNINLAKYLL